MTLPTLNFLAILPQIIVVARVTKSGNATAQSGDLEGSSKPVKPGAAGVVVVIDTARK